MLFSLLSGNFSLESAIIQILVILLVVFVFLPVHEFAHAGVAYLMGDKAIKYRGRLTFNPLAHVDPMGALCLLLFGFGWARPVPVDDRNFKNPKIGMALTALAGPLSNFLCAFVAGGALVLIVNNPIEFFMTEAGGYVLLFLYFFVSINVSLAVFNLIPMPPLDGSKILFAFLPDRAVAAVNSLQRYSFIIIYALIFLLSRSGILDVIDTFFIKVCLLFDPFTTAIFGII